jgi:RHS repeat-associated protein
MSRAISLRLALGLLATQISFGQGPVTGTPQFNSFGGGPFDIINLGNLNTHFAIPVVHKAGRGMPFNYDISYDSSIWAPATVNDVLTWQPVGGWGWQSQTDAATGYIPPPAVTVTNTICPPNKPGFITTSTYPGFADSLGTFHHVSNLYLITSCHGNLNTTTGTTDDGSAYTVTLVKDINTGVVTGTVNSAHGTVQVVPVATRTGTASKTDANGNQITTTDGLTFTDTLGVNTLTISGGAPSPLVFTYTGPAGSPTVKLNYTQKTVCTHFGAPGIAEYPPTSAYLVTSVSMPDTSSYTITYESTPSPPTGCNGAVTGRIASVKLPTGGTISYSYQGGYNGIFADGTTSYISRTTPDSSIPWTYSRAGTNPTYTTTVTDPQSNHTVINFEEDGSGSGYFYETQRKVYQGAATGTPLETVVTCYNGNTTTCPTAAVASPLTEVNAYRQFNTSSQARVDTFYNQNVLPTRIDRYDFGAASPSQKTVIAYATYLGSAFVGQPACVQVTAGTTPSSCGTVTSDTASLTNYLNYDSHGNVGKVQRWVKGTSSPSYLNSTFTYYSTGLVHVATDVNGAQTTFTYGDCGNSFATKVDLPATTYGGAMSASMTWNCDGGVPATATDVNQKQTTYAYDDMWRAKDVDYPDGGEIETAYNITSDPPNITAQRLISGSNNWLATQTNLDGLGRVVQKQLTSDPAGTDYVDTNYDALGRVASVSNPHRSGSSNTDGTTGFSHDALGRTTVITRPDNKTVNLTYTGAATEVQDEGYDSAGTLHITKMYQADGLGRLASVCEVSSTTQANGATPVQCPQNTALSGFLTSYSYDPLGNVTTVAQPGISNRTYSYDGLSRLTQEVNPESGTTTYTYDSTAGDLYQRKRANNVVSTYTFDVLHRLVYVSNSDGTNAGFSYDRADAGRGHTAANPNGNLTYMAANNNGYSYSILSYDTVGRVQDTWQCTPKYCNANAFNTHYTYDFIGDVLSATDGEGHTYSYLYNTAGELTNVTSSLSGGNYLGTLASTFQYDPLGHQTSVNLGNGLISQHAYSNRGWLSSVQVGTTGNPTSAYSLALSYAPDGDVTRANDSANGNWQYLYDDLNRLVCAGIPVCPHDQTQTEGFTYDYDQFGNRWHQNLTAGSGLNILYTFNGHNQIDGVGYDAAGNMTNYGGFVYNADGQMTSDNVYGLSYDAAGNMVEQKNLSSGSTADYVFQGTHEITSVDGNGVWSRGEVHAQGWHVNTYGNGDTLFAHNDQIDTTRVRTDHAGNIVEHCENDPFGTYLLWCGGAWESDIYYTGQLELNDGMIVFPARSFHSQSGRFTVPDPAGMAAVDPGNPQTWNRYAYVTNNPLSYIDPWGLYRGYPGQCDISGDGCGGGGAPGDWCPGCLSFGSGVFQSSLTVYLNGIPGYMVQGGELYLSYAIAGTPYWTSPDDMWNLPSSRINVDLGPIDAGALSSWGSAPAQGLPLFAGVLPPGMSGPFQFAKWAAKNYGKSLNPGNPQTIPGAPNAPPQFPGDFQSYLTKLAQEALAVIGDLASGAIDVFVTITPSPCIDPMLGSQLPSCRAGQNP